jgi:hypothetical protein
MSNNVGRSDEEVRKEIRAIRQELRRAQMEIFRSRNLHDVCDKLDTVIKLLKNHRST